MRLRSFPVLAGVLALAEATLTRLEQKVDRLEQRGKLTPECAAEADLLLDALVEEVAGFGLGPPETTTTTTLAGTTTTSSTVPLPGTSTTTTLPSSLCGNGQLDPGEQCDGENLFGRTCLTLRFTGGELGCRPDCIFDVSRCTF